MRCGRNTPLSGTGDYGPTVSRSIVEITGPFAGFAKDPWSDPNFTRDPLSDEVDVAIIGAGFGGLLTGARLRELGVEQHPAHRQGRRRGRHLVLEPVPGHRL